MKIDNQIIMAQHVFPHRRFFVPVWEEGAEQNLGSSVGKRTHSHTQQDVQNPRLGIRWLDMQRNSRFDKEVGRVKLANQSLDEHKELT